MLTGRGNAHKDNNVRPNLKSQITVTLTISNSYLLISDCGPELSCLQVFLLSDSGMLKFFSLSLSMANEECKKHVLCW